MNLKYQTPLYVIATQETTEHLEKIQPPECFKEMNRVGREFIACMQFSSSAERALAREIFEKSWRLARYYKELE